ncbi:hypothetical protein V1224_00840 [Lachnospiraceae bacterium JLR.KK008]
MNQSDRYSNINGIQLQVPAFLEGVIPVSPCQDKFHYEPFAFLGGVVCLKPGDTVFDIGVAWGVMTSMFASMVSADGAGERCTHLKPIPECGSIRMLCSKPIISNRL